MGLVLQRIDVIDTWTYLNGNTTIGFVFNVVVAILAVAVVAKLSVRKTLTVSTHNRWQQEQIGISYSEHSSTTSFHSGVRERRGQNNLKKLSRRMHTAHS